MVYSNDNDRRRIRTDPFWEDAATRVHPERGLGAWTAVLVLVLILIISLCLYFL
jgi:hypothetical protein